MRKGSAQWGRFHHGTEQLGDSLALRDEGVIAIASALPVEPCVESAAILEASDMLRANKDMTACMHAGLADLHESLHDCTFYIWSSLPGLQGCQLCLRCLPIQHAHQGTPKPEVVDDLYNRKILSEPGKCSEYVWHDVLLGYLMTHKCTIGCTVSRERLFGQQEFTLSKAIFTTRPSSVHSSAVACWVVAWHAHRDMSTATTLPASQCTFRDNDNNQSICFGSQRQPGT